MMFECCGFVRLCHRLDCCDVSCKEKPSPVRTTHTVVSTPPRDRRGEDRLGRCQSLQEYTSSCKAREDIFLYSWISGSQIWGLLYLSYQLVIFFSVAGSSHHTFRSSLTSVSPIYTYYLMSSLLYPQQEGCLSPLDPSTRHYLQLTLIWSLLS